MIESIKAYKFTYTPFNRDYPIRSCELIIYAKTRKEAELIALDEGWKFFDQDCSVVVETIIEGYRKI